MFQGPGGTCDLGWDMCAEDLGGERGMELGSGRGWDARGRLWPGVTYLGGSRPAAQTGSPKAGTLLQQPQATQRGSPPCTVQGCTSLKGVGGGNEVSHAPPPPGQSL